MNREDIRSPARSIANIEFRHTGDELESIAHTIVATLEQEWIRAINPAVGFPMEMEREKAWVISHNPEPLEKWCCLLSPQKHATRPSLPLLSDFVE